MSDTDIERALATLALDHQLVDPVAAVRVLRDARQSARPLVNMVREMVPEAPLLAAVASELGVRFLDLDSSDAVGLVTDDRVLRHVDVRLLTDHAALPLVAPDGSVVVAMANPLDVDITGYLRTRFPPPLVFALAPRSQVQARLLALSSDDDAGEVTPTSWVGRLLARAVAANASDVHLRFLADSSLMVRFRVDGLLRQVRFPDQLAGREQEVVGTVLARCPTIDPANLREPQDGTFSFSAGGRSIDVRVGMVPQVHGANVTLRLLDSLVLRRRPEDMGFAPEHLEVMRAALAASQGSVLVVGPTGSGKTTTIYLLLNEVDAMRRNVMTVEDPVEYRLPFVGQTQVRADLGDRSVTWTRALRALLRADPDVILIGEVRDAEVARVAMEAAITGHTCVTSVHAHSAPGAYARMVQMGVAPYLVADAVSLIVSQRLVRRVHSCAAVGPPSAEDVAALTRLGVEVPDTVAQARGCTGCAGTGYKGRLATAEVLVPNARLRALVGSGAGAEALYDAAVESGWTPIAVDAARHLRAHATTPSEVARVLADAGRGADAGGDEEDSVSGLVDAASLEALAILDALADPHGGVPAAAGHPASPPPGPTSGPAPGPASPDVTPDAAGWPALPTSAPTGPGNPASSGGAGAAGADGGGLERDGGAPGGRWWP